VVNDYLSDPGLRRIPCYMLLHRIVFQLWFRVAKYSHRLSTMKDKNIGIGTKKVLSIELHLKSNQSNWISRASSLAQLTI